MGKAANYPSVDLHGAKTDEVFDRLDKFLRREDQRGTPCVRIIHGIGTGKVKDKALEYCKLTGHQPKPDLLANNKPNPGSFLLYL